MRQESLIIFLIITLVATQAVLLLLSPHTPLHLITYFRFGSRYPRKLTKSSDFMAGKEILTAVLVRLQGWSQVGGLSTSSLVLYIPLDVWTKSCLALLLMDMSSSAVATKANSRRKILIQPKPLITALDWGVPSQTENIGRLSIISKVALTSFLLCVYHLIKENLEKSIYFSFLLSLKR